MTMGYSRGKGSAFFSENSLLRLSFFPFSAGNIHLEAFTNQSYGNLSERVHPFLLAASVLTLPTPLSIFTYKHFPDFFWLAFIACVYYSSESFCFSLASFSMHLVSFLDTFFCTSRQWYF